MQESFSLARDEIDATLHVAFRMDDEASRIRVNRRELHEVGAQLVANAVEAMGAPAPMKICNLTHLRLRSSLGSQGSTERAAASKRLTT